VTSVALPTLHQGRRGPSGDLTILDRAGGETYVVYTPRFESQFRNGHRAGLWYLRPSNSVGAEPRSLGFKTLKAAVDALKASSWRLHAATSTHRPSSTFRVIWSNPERSSVS
jgi:hypothetical protein